MADRIGAIPNGFDPEDFRDLPTRQVPADDQAIRFLYAGSLRGIQDVGFFMDTFGTAARDQPGHLRLDMIGPIGPRFRDLASRMIPSHSLSIHAGVPHTEAVRRMAEADVLVLFTGGGGAGADTITGKLYEYLAMRRPILLVGPPGPAADLVLDSQAGIVVEPSNLARVASAIGQAADLARNPHYMGAAADWIERFDRRRLAEGWSTLLQAAASGSVKSQKVA